ncbi:MAG: phosphate starvation-inducible protein PhoH [Proteobacteria bacterium]|nr:phosphate starvation-inducible protein PhoH [Pseudomonadota bacterium]
MTGDLDKKIYVLDTNVLLFDAHSIYRFDLNDVMIPITVIEEIDRFKKDLNDLGRNARLFSRLMDQLRKQGSLAEGVVLPSGGKLWVGFPLEDSEHIQGLSTSNDNRILMMTKKLARGYQKGQVVLVTKDTNMRIKADALELETEDFQQGFISVEEDYSGVRRFSVPNSTVGEIYAEGGLNELPKALAVLKPNPNQFFILESIENSKQKVMTRFIENKGLVRVQVPKEGIWGLTPRNREQVLALELLLDPNIHLVTLTGLAGTGKTLLAIAAGLQQTTKIPIEENLYRRLVVSRPIFPMGRDLGFLPGDISEKLNPWMKPIFDNLELLLGGNDRDRNQRRDGPIYQMMIDQGLIEVEPLTYIRGRSMAQQYLIVDEAQNLTPHEIKTVITRAGEGTKVVLTGDPQQIDNPYVDASSNGLSYVVERLKGSSLVGHITLTKGERSVLAELAAQSL